MPIMVFDQYETTLEKLIKNFKLETGMDIEISGFEKYWDYGDYLKKQDDKLTNGQHDYISGLRRTSPDPFFIFHFHSSIFFNYLKNVYKISGKLINTDGRHEGLFFREHMLSMDFNNYNKYRAELLKVNAKLELVERELTSEYIRIERMLEKEVKKNRFMHDYELEVTLNFFLKPDDPLHELYTEIVEGGVFFTYEQFFVKTPDEYDEIEKFDNYNHSQEDLPEEQRDRHCRLLWILSERHEMTWSDIARIGEVWVNIKPVIQRFYE